MNTIRSVWYGWGVLIAAGGGAYFFAKREINAERASKAAAGRELYAKQAGLREAEASYRSQPSTRSDKKLPAGGDTGGNPSGEAASDPAPTRHAPYTEGQKRFEKSKYEASEPWRSPKGDRLNR